MIFVFLILCAIIAYCDLKWRLIPDRAIVIGIIIALLGNSGSKLGFIGAMVGLFAGTLCLGIVGVLCVFWYKRPSIGGGDVKLLAMIGAFWGWQVALITFAIAPVMGSLLAGILNRTKMAYGVFLIVASLIALIIGRVYGF